MDNSGQQYLKNANELKKHGQLEAALTDYRRAALADPSLLQAHLEIGLLCREKAKHDSMFQRYSFEAFQKAARLDLTHEEAHNYYIMAGQKMKLLEDLHREYDQWVKDHPDNDLLKKCLKSIIAISMAMIPEKVNISEGGSSTIRKFVLIVSLSIMLIGFVLILTPAVLKQIATKNMEKEQGKALVHIGLVMNAAGLGGLIIFTRLRKEN